MLSRKHKRSVSPLTRGGAGCCWSSISSTRLCSSSRCRHRCKSQRRQQNQSDTTPVWPEAPKPPEIPDTFHRAKMSAKHKLSICRALADWSHHWCLPACLPLSVFITAFPPLPLALLCLAGASGFSTTAGQTQAAFANKCSSVLAINWR